MNLTWERILCIQTDRGTEFLNATKKEWADSLGIHMQSSFPRAPTPQPNGAAERCIRIIKDMARTTLAKVKGPSGLWYEAVAYVAWVSYYLPVQEKSFTPFQAMRGYKPDISNLRVWWCLAYVKIPDTEVDGLSPVLAPGMFVGMDPKVKGWRVRVGNKTVRSCNVYLFEDRPGATSSPKGIYDEGSYPHHGRGHGPALRGGPCSSETTQRQEIGWLV